MTVQRTKSTKKAVTDPETNMGSTSEKCPFLENSET